MSLVESDGELEGEETETETETETGSVHSDSTITMQAPWIEMRGGDGAIQVVDSGDGNAFMEKGKEKGKEKEKASSPTHLTVPLQRQPNYGVKVSRTLLDKADVHTTGAEKAIVPPTRPTDSLQRQQGKISRSLLDNADMHTAGAEKTILPPTRPTDSLQKQQQRRAKVVKILEDADVALARARQMPIHQRAAVSWLCLGMTRFASTIV